MTQPSPLKKLLPGYLLCFATAFMLLLSEPLMMYVANTNDLYFDFGTLFSTSLIVFVVGFLGLSLVITLLYLLSRKFRQPWIYDGPFIVALILFLVTYIQGNYLVANLPALNGDAIDWSRNIPDMIISLVLLIVVAAIVIIAAKKLGATKLIHYSTFVSLAIVAMLAVSTFATMSGGDSLTKSSDPLVTTINLDNISTDQNFFILVVDAVDAAAFQEVIQEHPEYQSVFTDFTYYPDTLSAYTFTRDAIPFILSGEWNENTQPFLTYYRQAIADSPLLSELDATGYDINIFDYEFKSDDSRVQNIVTEQILTARSCLVYQELKYTAYRYVPYYLKPFTHIDNLDFNLCRRQDESSTTDVEILNWWMPDKYRNMLANPTLTKQDNKYFQFLHLEGAHTPFDLTAELEEVPQSSYEQEIAATILYLDTFLKRLRLNDSYDNSAIIIMADHGYSDIDTLYRQNPLLLVKGFGEQHDFVTSDIPVSHADLLSIYSGLLAGQQSSELLRDADPSRTRRFITNNYNAEEHMVEYVQNGPAWDKSGITATGKEFNL